MGNVVEKEVKLTKEGIPSFSIPDGDNLHKNLDKWVEFISWARWNVDLFLDLITPETGGIRLDLDQRVFIRTLTRFVSVYGVFPRGYGKTFSELLAMYVCAILYPDANFSMSAQTMQQATKLVEEKHKEIVKFYPLIGAEIIKAQFSKDSAEIHFASGSSITTLANAQSSKGSRRHSNNLYFIN